MGSWYASVIARGVGGGVEGSQWAGGASVACQPAAQLN